MEGTVPKPVPRDSLPGYLFKARQLAADLEHKGAVLPPVNNRGESECPHAEKLYASARRVELGLERLRELIHTSLGDLEREIAAMQGQRNVIAAGRDRLLLEGTREHFRAAENAQEERIEQVIALRDEALETLALADQALRRAAEKRWPLGEPRDEYGNVPGSAPRPRTVGPGFQPPRHSPPGGHPRSLSTLAPELDSLIDVGSRKGGGKT